MKKFFKEFKEFAMKGNILDMAIGVIIGGAFGKIVSSLVADIVTPLISLLTGKASFADLKWVITEANEAEGIAENALMYGNFIQTIIDFLLVALTIFIVIRVMMKTQKKLESLKKKEEEEVVEEEPAEPEDTELSLLKEIRDMMKKDDAE